MREVYVDFISYYLQMVWNSISGLVSNGFLMTAKGSTLTLIHHLL